MDQRRESERKRKRIYFCVEQLSYCGVVLGVTSRFVRRDGKLEFMRILVIEDEVKLAAHLSRALEYDGHEVRVVHDGKVASVEGRDGNYDLLVLDVELPRMDGFEILKQLRSCGVASRILMLTARSENPDKIAGLTGGADDYLTKPFAMNELLARVNAFGASLCCAYWPNSSRWGCDIETR